MVVIVIKYKNNIVKPKDVAIQAHDSVKEIIWTVVPSLMIIAMIVPSLTILYEQDKIRKPWIRLVAVGNQWFWTYAITTAKINKFIFDCYIIKSSDLRLGMPRVLETDNNLILPTNKWIRLLVTAVNVIHSFGLPTLGLRFDGIPGRLNAVAFQFARAGFFRGTCMELCGMLHA